MPKKLGINTKAVEAKARKDAIKQANNELKERQKEDQLWKDEDKHVLRKQNRKDEKEKKKQEVVHRKASNRAAYEEEMSCLKSRKASEEKTTKISRFDIKETIEKQQQTKQMTTKEVSTDQQMIEENINRLMDTDDSARTVEDAIALLSTKDAEIDRHPEKRMKAAFAAFEASNLTRIKNENPNLRLSQLKQILKKDWMKSPENPLNQLTTKYNSKD